MSRRSRPFHLVLLALAALAFASPGAAQDKSTYYTVRHPHAFKINWKAFYDKADELTAETRRALPHRLDLPYGEDPKHRLDIYMPAALSVRPSIGSGRMVEGASRPSGAPVFVFLHGGGFREGDRAHYGYVARPFAAHGIVTVVASYRLTPAARFPDQPDDVRRALAWVYRNATQYGGSPDRIYIGGHSAGAVLAAFVSVETSWLAGASLPRDLVKGCIPISGPYDLRNHPSLVEYVPDLDKQTAASPLLLVERPAPAVVAVGSVEPYVDSSRALVERIRAKGVGAELVVLAGLPHDQTALALGDERGPLFQAILRLIEDRSARSSGSEIEGLWRYRRIQPAGGGEVAIDGLFLFAGDRFLQQSLNEGKPYDRQLAQAHAGTVRREADGSLSLAAEVGLVVDPARARAVELRHGSEHRIQPTRTGDALVLTFGSGTVQTFVRVGNGPGEIVALDRGALALVGGHFILVVENNGRAESGSGTFVREGARLLLKPERWFSIRDGAPRYARGDTIAATLDGRTLRLPDGTAFTVRP